MSVLPHLSPDLNSYLHNRKYDAAEARVEAKKQMSARRRKKTAADELTRAIEIAKGGRAAIVDPERREAYIKQIEGELKGRQFAAAYPYSLAKARKYNHARLDRLPQYAKDYFEMNGTPLEEQEMIAEHIGELRKHLQRMKAEVNANKGKYFKHFLKKHNAVEGDDGIIYPAASYTGKKKASRRSPGQGERINQPKNQSHVSTRSKTRKGDSGVRLTQADKNSLQEVASNPGMINSGE